MSKGGKFILEQSLREENDTLYNLKFLNSKISDKSRFLSETENYYDFSFKKYYKPVVPVSHEWTEEPLLSTFTFNGTNYYLLPVYGDFIGEMFVKLVINVKMTSPLDTCYFCDFPGHRIPRLTRLTFSGITVDEYPSDAYNVYYNYFLSENKKKSWREAVGQSSPIEFSSGFEKKNFNNSPQFPKNSHLLTLYIPILFDCSTSFDKPLFSAAIPFGQRFVELNTNDISQIIFPQNNGGGGNYSLNVLSSLWIKQTFVYRPIIDKLLNKNYFIPVRTFRYETFFAETSGKRKLDRMKWQLESLFFGGKPNSNPDDWWRFHDYDVKTVYIPAETLNPNPPPIHQLIFQTSNIKIPKPIITSANFTSVDVDLMKSTSSDFYNILQPLCKSRSPEDPGLLLYVFAEEIPLIFEKKKEKYTSFYNVSIDKNFYFNYEISAPCEILIMGKAINRLIISANGIVNILYP